MKVKVRCDECNKTYKIRVSTMKEVRRVKRATSCTCTKCIGMGVVDLEGVYGDTVVLIV